MKIKVLYVVSTLRNTGPTNQLFGIISNLDRSRFEYQVLTLSPEPENSRMDNFINAGIPVESLSMKRFQFLISGKKALISYISNFNPDVIHSSGLRADGTLSKCNVKNKHCMTIRNFASEDFISKFGRVLGTVATKSSTNAMNRCDYVVTCSNTLKKMYAPILKTNVRAIQNGVDTEKYFQADILEEKMYLREKLLLPKNKTIIVMVGSLIERKNPVLVAEEFIAAKIENAILLILGDGPMMEDIKLMESEAMILKGSVSNVSEYLRASDYYISASKSEGLPNSVLEAGVCGLKMILSDIPQHSEIFENKRELVNFFSLKDKASLRNCFKKIYDDNSQLGDEISIYIKNTFNNVIMSKKYQDLYFEITSNNEA